MTYNYKLYNTCDFFASQQMKKIFFDLLLKMLSLKKFAQQLFFQAPLKIFPTGSFVDLILEGGYYLDKTHFIHEIESLNSPAILSLRPQYFGKTLFLSTLSSYYDIRNKGNRFEHLFGNLHIGKTPTKLASSFLILNLNFSGLRTTTYETFENDFHKTLNFSLSRFAYQYQKDCFPIIDINKDALENFSTLLREVESSGNKLYVCIDEYDAGLAIKNENIFQIPTIDHKKNNSSTSKTGPMGSLLEKFYSHLNRACDGGTAHTFQTGEIPFTMNVDNLNDLTLNEKFWDLYGLKRSEIKSLLKNAFGNNLSDDTKEEIMKLLLKEENDGYFFNCNQTEGIYNPTRILYYFKNLIEWREFVDKTYYHDKSIKNIIEKLLNFPSDLYTLPSQKALDLIIKHPLCKSIFTKSLTQHHLEPQNDSIEFNTCKLMTYTSALTYKPSPNTTQYKFQIPNYITKKRFIAEMFKMYNWKEKDLLPVQKYLQILETTNNIEPLCQIVEQALVRLNNVNKHSNGVKQSFIDTLILASHTDINSEFQLNFQVSEKSIDLVKTSTGKEEKKITITIEFDNIEMKCIKLDKEQRYWQKESEVSMSLLNKPNNEILRLEINDPHQPKLKTVGEFLEYKIKKCKEYFKQFLKKDQNACLFVVLRVGLYRLISKQVNCTNL